MCACMWERGWVRVMARNGICFWTRASETPEEGEKGRKRRGMGWLMRHIMQYVWKKDSFLILFPPLVFEVTICSGVQWVSCPRKGFPSAPSQALYIIGPSWEEKRKKGSREEGCTLKSGAVVTEERWRGGGPPVTFLIAFHCPRWVMRFTGWVSASQGS